MATAHPHFDPDGTVHNIGHSYKGKPKICIIKIPPKKGIVSMFRQTNVVTTNEDMDCNVNKRAFGDVRTAKIQISLRIRAI